MTPTLSPDDPKIVIMSLLRDHWSDPSVTSDYAAQHDDFNWVIDSHFETNWIHTGWHDDSNPYPQLTVSFDSIDPGTTTGYNAITGDGGLSAHLDNRAYIDVWVRGDRDYTDGINPKKYAWHLRLRSELIILEYHDTVEYRYFGSGEVRSPAEPEDTPIGARWRIPVLFGDQKRT